MLQNCVVTLLCCYFFGSIFYELTKLRHFLGSKLDFCNNKKIILKDCTSGAALVNSKSTKSFTSTYTKSRKMKNALVDIVLVGDPLYIILAPFSLKTEVTLATVYIEAKF